MSEPNLTRRKQIIQLLRDQPYSFMKIANILKTTIREIEEDVSHIAKSYHLKTEHAYCRGCDFIFKDDKRFHTPSKCPMCHHERICAQRFWIQK